MEVVHCAKYVKALQYAGRAKAKGQTFIGTLGIHACAASAYVPAGIKPLH